MDDQDCEPTGHGIGRSGGGLTTKIHHAVDGRVKPLAIVITGGQRHDGVMLPQRDSPTATCHSFGSDEVVGKDFATAGHLVSSAGLAPVT